jgi:hypothetical protein
MDYKEQQQEEKEVLQSIYEGDENFKFTNDTTIQYKVTAEDSNGSFMVEIVWSENYPDSVPHFNMDTFYNKHISRNSREHIVAQLEAEAEQLIGSAMTYTLLEWLRDNSASLIGQHEGEDGELVARIGETTIEEKSENRGENEISKKPAKKEQMTKQQKRKLYGRLNAQGERPRGWDWVDIVKHLSQSGSGQQTQTSQTNSAS